VKYIVLEAYHVVNWGSCERVCLQLRLSASKSPQDQSHKSHLYNLFWICCTSCATNPQQIEASTANPQQVHNKSN